MKLGKYSKVLAVVAVIFLMFCGYLVNKRRAKLTEATKLPFYGTKLEEVADGKYTGKCYTSFAHVQMEITIENHQIKNIELLECDGLEAVKAKDIVNVMIEKNAVVVPAIKGAEIGSLVFISCADDAVTAADLKGN